MSNGPLDLTYKRLVNLPDGFDVNALKSPGVTGVKNPVNGPTSDDYYIITTLAGLDSGRNRLHQTAASTTTGTLHTRAYLNSVWLSWTEVGAGGGAVGRTKLTADTIFYVRTDGDDVNQDGLANTAASAFASPQGALEYICGNIDQGPYTATIQCGDGTYTPLPGTTGVFDTSTRPAVPNGVIVVAGNAADNTAVVFEGATSNFSFIHGIPGPTVYANDLTIKVNGTNALGIAAVAGALVIGTNVRFDITGGAFAVIYARDFGTFSMASDVDLSSSSVGADSVSYLLLASGGGQINVAESSIAMNSDVTITTAGVYADSLATIYPPYDWTGTGTVTGKKYEANLNSIINTFGGGSAIIPGNVAGSSGTGGQFL